MPPRMIRLPGGDFLGFAHDAPDTLTKCDDANGPAEFVEGMLLLGCDVGAPIYFGLHGGDFVIEMVNLLFECRSHVSHLLLMLGQCFGEHLALMRNIFAVFIIELSHFSAVFFVEQADFGTEFAVLLL